jgi:hypothetical protein
MFKRRNEIVPDGAPLDEASLKKAASANGLGMWNTYFALYGTEQTMAGVEPIIRATLTASGGEVLTAAEMGATLVPPPPDADAGRPQPRRSGLLRWRGRAAAWPGSPVAAARGVEAERQTALAKEIVESTASTIPPPMRSAGAICTTSSRCCSTRPIRRRSRRPMPAIANWSRASARRAGPAIAPGSIRWTSWRSNTAR